MMWPFAKRDEDDLPWGRGDGDPPADYRDAGLSPGGGFLPGEPFVGAWDDVDEVVDELPADAHAADGWAPREATSRESRGEARASRPRDPDGRADLARTKVCPQCGATLFADMPVCYGCLHEFSAEEELQGGLPAQGIDLGGFFSGEEGVDEGDMVVDERLAAMPGEAAGPAQGQGSLADAGVGSVDEPGPVLNEPRLDEAGRRPRHLAAPQRVAGLRCARPGRLGVELRGPGMLVRCHVPADGLTVGRDEDNDVVLWGERVSRHHVRILPAHDGLLVEDQGATNPALLNGQPVLGEEPFGPSDSLDLCGTLVRAVALA